MKAEEINANALVTKIRQTVVLMAHQRNCE